MNRRIAAPLSPEMNIFELIDKEPSVLSIFSRLDIRLPFGDMSIEDMCRRDGYSAELFMILCSMHTNPSYRPSMGDLSADMLPEVIGYLRASHHYYATYMLPHASAHLEEILEHADSRSRSVLRRFYDDYTHYIAKHFQEEEERIFAVVNNAAERYDADFSVIETPHTDIDDRTNDIASLITKSLPEAVPTSLRCAMLKDIYALRDDLRRHNNIETFLLKPLVELYLKSQA